MSTRNKIDRVEQFAEDVGEEWKESRTAEFGPVYAILAIQWGVLTLLIIVLGSEFGWPTEPTQFAIQIMSYGLLGLLGLAMNLHNLLYLLGGRAVGRAREVLA